MFEVSQGVSIFMVLFATFLWGSWFQCIKRLGKFPVSGFMLWLYTFSIIIVWGFIGLFGKFFLQDGVFEPIAQNSKLSIAVIICGALFAVGMQLQMEVLKRMGIILSVSVTASCNIIFGTVLSAIYGGLKENISITLLVIAAFSLIFATIICQIAGKRRTQEHGGQVEGAEFNPKMVVSLVFIILFLASAYPLAMAIGVKTEMNPQGFEPLLCVGILSIGSFIGTWIYSSFILTKNKLWKATFMPEDKTGIVMALISASCHYGGNIIHTIAIPQVSVAIAWPMGQAANLWSYIWGVLYGEFKGSSRKTYLILLSGILLFVVGVILLAINIY